jgi:hypothetical protein
MGHGLSFVAASQRWLKAKDDHGSWCYRSPEYAKAIEIRKGSAVADIIIVEGYHGAQPTDG